MRLSVVGIMGFVPALLVAQTTPASFTVASIKPNKSSDERFMLRPMPGGGLTATGVTLKLLILNAYEVAAYQISGGPAWMGSERWDIEAKTDGFQGRFSADQFDVMLRRLLEDRFQLKTHRQSKKLPAYALVVDKSGSKLKPHASDAAGSPINRSAPGSIAFENVPIAGLARMLSGNLGRPVLDRTRLAGNFDFQLEWMPENQGGPEAFGLPPRAEPPRSSDSSAPSIFTALEEQLGLKLKATKAPVDVLVIDRAERASEN